MKTTNVIKLVLAGLVLAVVYRMIVNRSRKGAMRELPGFSFPPESYDQDSDDGEGYEDEYYGDQDATEEYMEAAENYEDGEEETYDEEEETYGDEEETYGENGEAMETYGDDETEGFNDDPGDYPFTNAPPTGGVATNRLPNQGPGSSSNPGNWKDFAPKNALDQNFMDAAMQIGVDTVSSSLKNPSYDLRNNVPIPKSYTVSPWMQSNIDPDLTRNSLF
jgi:hypothetical protein